MSDMSLGLKSAEILCSLIMDRDFYVSHIDLRKNPLGDDGIILLMHAIKRVNSVIYLDLSSCNMTHIGAHRVLKSLCKNESIQHLVLSNSEG
jgi:Ran GTPase-activating protein (RanGAP) involved in mRNA processing and transport